MTSTELAFGELFNHASDEQIHHILEIIFGKSIVISAHTALLNKGILQGNTYKRIQVWEPDVVDGMEALGCGQTWMRALEQLMNDMNRPQHQVTRHRGDNAITKILLTQECYAYERNA